MTAPAVDGALVAPPGVRVLAGTPLPGAARVAIVAAAYHVDVVQPLVDGAVEELGRRGVAPGRIDLAPVPGAFELGLAARRVAETGRYAAVVALGCVIRGGTPHFDHVCAEAARGVQDAALATGVPVAFGVLTCDDHAQAVARAGGAHGNKGQEAAAAAADLAGLLAVVGRGPAADPTP